MEKKDTITGAKGDWKDRTVTGAYKLTHVKSGKFYVGSTGNFYERRKHHIVLLRMGKHFVTDLQELYNENPEIHFELFLTGYDEHARELAYDHEQSMLDENKTNPLMMNKSFDARKPAFTGEIEAQRIAAMTKTTRSPEYRAAQGEHSKIHRNTEHAKTRASEATAEQWKDPEKRKAIMGGRDSEEARQANSDRNKQQWQDPEYRKQMLESRQSKEARERLKQAIKDSGRTRKVKINGIVYDSLMDAVRATGVDKNSIKRRCLSPKAVFSEYEFVD